VLGVRRGGFLRALSGPRPPAAIRSVGVGGPDGSRVLQARAQEHAARRAAGEEGAAYRALWDGSLSDDTSFKRAFDTIRPLYFFDAGRAVETNAMRADIRYRLAVRRFIIEHEYASYDCRAELPRIACRTLVAGGRHDAICPVDQAEQMARIVPGAELAVFEHSGHSPQIEERD